jgi:hypothetical protein
VAKVGTRTASDCQAFLANEIQVILQHKHMQHKYPYTHEREAERERERERGRDANESG